MAEGQSLWQITITCGGRVWVVSGKFDPHVMHAGCSVGGAQLSAALNASTRHAKAPYLHLVELCVDGDKCTRLRQLLNLRS